MIAFLCTALEKLPSQVKAITVREYHALVSCWERFPPASVSLARLAAAQTTWKPKEKPKPFRESTPEEIAAFFGASGLSSAVRRTKRPDPK